MLKGVRDIQKRLKKDESTCIADIKVIDTGESTTCDLLVEFQQRGTYIYHYVNVDDAQQFSDAGLKGSYFNLYIRPNYTDFERVS